MVSLTTMVKAAKADLPITLRHEKWSVANPNPVYSPRAIEFALGQLNKETGGNRRRRRAFRASGLGTCPRRRILAFTGQKERTEIDGKLSNIFQTGNFMHLKWQMAGLTEGWLTDAEVPVDEDSVPMSGTMDGMVFDGSGFECKSINNRGYTFVMRNGIEWKHQLQAGGYMILRNLPAFSFVYENKDTGEWRELRLERTPGLVEAVHKDIKVLTDSVANQTIPDMLPDCVKQVNATWRNCPFRDICPTFKSYPKGPK